LPLIEVEQELPTRFGEVFAQPQKEAPPLHDDARIGERPLDARQQSRDFGEAAVDHPQRAARGQQLHESLRHGHFFEVKMAESPNDSHRPQRSLPLPATDRRHRHSEQLRQHRRRVEPLHRLIGCIGRSVVKVFSGHRRPSLDKSPSAVNDATRLVPTLRVGTHTPTLRVV
jgi:hypothetical protein